MRKLLYILREMIYLMRKEKLYALAVVLFVLILVALFVYQITPVAVVTFIYAGI
jgi:hypothetical protein